MALPIYAEASGVDLDAENIAIVAAGGKTGIPTLYRIFTGLGIPTYVIWDADRAKNEHGDTNRHIAAMLDAHLDVFPDTTVTDRFAVWTEDFEDELGDAVADYADLEQAARELYGSAGKGEIVLRPSSASTSYVGADAQSDRGPLVAGLFRRRCVATAVNGPVFQTVENQSF